MGQGDVEVKETSCDVKGLEKIVQEAISKVTDGMAENLGMSVKIREAANAGHAGSVGPSASPPSPLVQAVPVVPAVVQAPAQLEAAATAVTAEPSALVFRAIIRDENRNQLLHQGENVSVEIEVKNEGPGTADGVEILVSGSPALVEMIPAVLAVGDLAAGDVKRLSVNGKVGQVSGGPSRTRICLARKVCAVQLPSVKKFLVALKPADAPDAVMVPVDVDDLAKIPASSSSRKQWASRSALGNSASGLARVKYAHQDAEMMAKYWSAVGGIPGERIRRLFDSRALKSDLAEAFEEWLPKQVDPTTVVYVFIAGRGLVDPATGAVLLIPFDGAGASSARLFSSAGCKRH